jgi:hypothetical protein
VKRAPGDLAAGGHFTVTDLRAANGEWDFEVTGYAADGQMLLKTVHKSEASMQIECMAWVSRGAREKQ